MHARGGRRADLTAANPALLQARPAQPAIAWATSTLGLLATWIFLAVLAAVTGDTDSHPALLAIPVLGAAWAGFLQLALRAVPGAGTRSGLPLLAGELVLLTYYCPALWRIATLAWRCSRRTNVRHIDMGMRAISSAAAADLALILIRTAVIIERSSGIPVAEPEIAAVAAAQAVVAIQVIGGATVSVWFPGLAMLSRQGLLWCAYWRLHLLWATLRHAVPQIELPRQPGTRFNVRYRLHRRVIEIRDAQLILKPYWRGDISEQAAAAARSARLTAARRSAVVEAAVIVTALNAWQQGTLARDDGPFPGARQRGTKQRSPCRGHPPHLGFSGDTALPDRPAPRPSAPPGNSAEEVGRPSAHPADGQAVGLAVGLALVEDFAEHETAAWACCDMAPAAATPCS